MSFISKSRDAFAVLSRQLLPRAVLKHEPGGFVTNGGEFKEGLPPPYTPPPPSRYDTFAALDNKLTQDKWKVPEIFKEPPPPPPPPPSIPRDERPYAYEVFDYVAKTAGLEQKTFIDVGLTVGGANTPGQVKICDIDRAGQLNQQHREEHTKNYPNQEWRQPHKEKRMVVEYTPNVYPTIFERLFSTQAKNLKGDAAHAQVFVAPVGSLSINELEKSIDRYQVIIEPDRIGTATLHRPSKVTRSIVARSTSGEIQYMVYRKDADFSPKPG